MAQAPNRPAKGPQAANPRANGPQAANPPANGPQAANPRAVLSWMLFDWANQPFHTLLLTFIFAPYFAARVAPSPAEGQATWGAVVGAAGVAVALLAPLVGAIADQSGPRKPWMAAFSVLLVAGAAALWLAVPGLPDATLVLTAFFLAFVGAEFMMIFSNAMLPDLAPRDDIGRVSGSGWAMGYVGGVVSLMLVLLFLAPSPGKDTTLIGLSPLFGLSEAAGEPARATGPLTALWFLVFALPLFLFVPDAPRGMGLGAAIRAGRDALLATLRRLPGEGSLTAYLVSSMIYRDALAGLYAFGGIYAGGVLGWGLFQLGLFGIVAAITGAVGAWAGGRADRAFGPLPVIRLSILVLIAVCVATLTTSRTAVLLVPVPEGSGLPDVLFYVCGALIGAAGGALQAASRTAMVHQAEGRVPMTEAFGLYALSGKATAFLAPWSVALVTGLTGSQALGISPLIALFALGLFLLGWVKTSGQGQATQGQATQGQATQGQQA
jgi:UMF1 family MFS transporter